MKEEGVIVDISKNKLTVLTPDGDFLEIDNKHKFNQIGDLIYFEPNVSNSMIRTRFKRKKTTIKTVIALAAGILLIFRVLPIILEDSKVYAYVSLGKDSSIEFSVSESMEVLEVQGINQEGIEILANLHGWQNQDVAIVAAQILLLLQKEGKIEEKNEVVISTVFLDKDKNFEKNLEEKLTNVQASSENILNIKTQKATVDDRQKAKEKGVSTAAYLETNPEKESTKKDSKEAENHSTPAERTSGDSREVEPPVIKDEQKPANERKPSYSPKEEEGRTEKFTESGSEGLVKDHSKVNKDNTKHERKPSTSEQKSLKQDVKEKKQEKAERPYQQWNSNNRTPKEQKSYMNNDDKLKSGLEDQKNGWHFGNNPRKNNRQMDNNSKEKNNHGPRNHEN